MKSHSYRATTRWTGDLGTGTSGYGAYSRNHEIAIPGKPTLPGSADAAFRGDPARWNPEDALLGAISACHMLWFLNLAAAAGWIVRDYVDHAEARMEINADGSGQFAWAMLRPAVAIAQGDMALSDSLHHRAHDMCFIARSLNFPVRCKPDVSMLG